MAGELLVAERQYSLGSLLIGTNTPWVVQSAAGLDMPNVADSDMDLPGRHGIFVGNDYLMERVVELTLGFHDDAPADTMAALLNELQTAVWSPSSLQEFSFWFPGQVKKTMQVRPRKFAAITDWLKHKGMVKGAALRLVAPDPRIYTAAASQAQGTIAVSGTSIQFTAAVGGRVDTEPVITMTGPFRNPRLQNVEANKTIRIDMDVQAAETLVVDVKNRTITHEGSNVYGNKRSDNEWWHLLPNQNNTIVFSRDGATLTGSTATATVDWNDAWLFA